ncbi:threonyl-tRNA synthetase [Candidatus Termititenax persephonae]|uniref:Threonine--tRNA ligase n=1 Tax=Candidatus Termititenax persephonae TaxID=2218525 RepID=A0A388TFW6_9BACT|nr:threonyl-tRNA synthetase [Candidatus Termititenax persephonae]
MSGEQNSSELSTLRHSASHILAAAVKRLYPGVSLAIGPAIADGFYYDFDFAEPISDKDLPAIEKEMRKIIKQNPHFTRRTVSKAEAEKLLKDEPYKLELLADLTDGEISFYDSGDFSDLCAGPHVEKASQIKAVKLLKVAGAYWRGSEKNKMLTRIYGTAFTSPEELENYLQVQEEALQRDHRKLGKELDLFSFHEEGLGFPFFHNKGMILWNTLLDFWREKHRKYGYQETKTPVLLNRALWEKSGHWFNYRENMYTTRIDDEDFAIKPMNCPGGILLYGETQHSYRELPLRSAEIGLVHRHEKSGVLSGLFRVRAFHQDDAHVFMTPEQILPEIQNVLKLVEEMYSVFGLSYHLELSTRPEKSVGSDEAWAHSERALEDALKITGREYKVNPGDGAFYGPKIDIHIKDALGRTWQCGTIQLDMNLPELFDLSYIGPDDQKHRPVMIHRVVYGSMERFLGILIEHYAGKFPLWLAPVQVKILTISDKHNEYAQKLFDQLTAENIRAELDTRSEKIGYKIRQAQMEKVGYMAVLGDKECAENTLSVRDREGQSETLKTEDFIGKLRQEIRERK